VTYNGSVDCKLERVKLGMQNACLRSFQNLVSHLAFLRFVSCLSGRSFVLFRSVNVTAYSLTVEQGLMQLGFGANICLGKIKGRTLARSAHLYGRLISLIAKLGLYMGLAIGKTSILLSYIHLIYITVFLKITEISFHICKADKYTHIYLHI
jgi:hypothetical protein